MNLLPRYSVLSQLTVILLIAAPIGLFAQDRIDDREDDEPVWVSSLQEMMVFVDAVEARLNENNEIVNPIKKPLFTYYDAVRIVKDGGIWAWGEEGRPVALAKCFLNGNKVRTRAFAVSSDQLITVTGPQNKVWRPQRLQFEPRPLPEAPLPATGEAIRLLRFKQQARRFSAYERWDPQNSRFELRLLERPIHRYTDAQRQILDGAVFVLAVDNNPQILLLLEMLEEVKNGSRWQYILCRVSSAELHVSLDGKEIWSDGRTPGVLGLNTDPYWHMATNPEGDIAP